MELKDFIKEVIKTLPDGKDVGITFELGLMSDGKTMNDKSKNRVKFSITNRK